MLALVCNPRDTTARKPKAISYAKLQQSERERDGVFSSSQAGFAPFARSRLTFRLLGFCVMGLYVRVLNSFYSHRKTLRLRAILGDAAYWVPPRLWAYAAENQPDGCFSGYSAEELAIVIGYSGDAQAMLQAMLQAGFLESEPLRIHGWEEHNSYHSTFAERAKKAAEARWAKSRPPTPPEKTGKERKGKEASIASSIAQASTSNATSINPTLDAVLLQGAKIGLPEAESQKFFNYYESNGWKVGRNPMKSWTAAMTNWRANWQSGIYGNNQTNSKPSQRGFDRNKGTLNEGKAHLYVPKAHPMPKV